MKMNDLMAKTMSLLKGSDSVDQVVSDNMDILDKLEKIVEISQKYGITKCLNKGKAHFDYVTKIKNLKRKS